MLFNSIEFAIFLPIVFGLYWVLGKERIKAQNAFILLASYLFYGWWDYRFLILIFISSFVDYLIGIRLYQTENQKKRKNLLWLSLGVNLGLLGFFKYFNFFVDSFIQAFTLFGKNLTYDSLSIILPVGISFYTFQTLSYTIDVYLNKMKPTKDPISFFAYVSFFPQLVAGPIERAKNLLPQFERQRTFDYALARDGMLQIVWGLFKKVVIADNCAIYVNKIFEHYGEVNSSTLLLGLIYFLFQVYCDFSGYSDMAIGLGKLFGFKLMKNFDYPFFSRTIPEFWKKWHISLTSWFVDYVYIPLGGSRKGLAKKIRNVFIIFIVSGFWHGANWTFIAWGFFCALAFLPSLLRKKEKQYSQIVAEGKTFPSLKEFFQMLGIFSFIMLSMILFRSPDIQTAWNYTQGLFSFNFHPFDLGRMDYFYFIVILLIWEWLSRSKEHSLQIDHLKQPVRWVIYFATTWSILYYFGQEQEYIYFQF